MVGDPDLPVIIISGGPNSNDFASDRILHHTTGLLEVSLLWIGHCIELGFACSIPLW